MILSIFLIVVVAASSRTEISSFDVLIFVMNGQSALSTSSRFLASFPLERLKHEPTDYRAL